MQNLNAFKTLSWGDFKNIQRDALLVWMLIVPVLVALLIRLAVPPLTTWLMVTYTFDLRPYYDAFMGYFLISLAPMMLGIIIGFLLLDERDDDTLTALQVTPLSLNHYLLYRLGVPVLLSVLMTWIVFPVAGLVPLPFWGQALIACLAALEAPIYALFLASFAENKVAGLALMKGVSAVLILPLVTYFIDSNWQLLAGIIPTYWPLKLFWLIQPGNDASTYWGYFAVGLVFHTGLLVTLLRRFDRIMH